MIKWIAIVFAFFCISASAQIPMTGAGRGAPAAAGGGCSQATAFLARATTVTLAADKTRYTTLICNLVTDGIFAKLDGLYAFGLAPDSTSAQLNLIQNAFNLTPNVAPTFTAYQGFTGNGGTMWLDSGFTPGTSTGNYAQNSASLGIWTRTAPSGATGDFSGMLAGDTSVESDITNGFFDTTTISTDINSGFAGGSPSITATGTGVGFSMGNRSASNAVQLYHIGSSVGTNTTASVALTSAVSLAFLTRNFAGSANQSSNEQMSIGVFGGSLSSTDHANLCHELGAALFSSGAIGSNPC